MCGRPTNLLNKYNNVQGIFLTITHPLTLSRTCEALAVAEVHALHSFGEYEFVDSACEREGEERGKDKVRNEERCAAGRKKLLNKIIMFRKTS